MIDKLIKLASLKDSIDLKRGEKKYFEDDWLIGQLLSEIQEVKDEIRPNNKPFLEDELGDILWGWLVLVQKMKSKGLVTSHESIIKRALKKYEERILPLKGDKRDNDIWKEVKAKQKKRLNNESSRI